MPPLSLMDAADCCALGTAEVLWSAELNEERVELLLSEVWILCPQMPDLPNDPPIVPTLPLSLRGTGAAVEGLEFASPFREPLLPQEECPTLHTVCFRRCRETVRLPKADNLCSLLRDFTDHIREPYRVLLQCPRTFDAPINAEYSHAP